MMNKKLKPFDIFVYVILSVGAVSMVVPFIWTILSSLKTMGQTFSVPPTIWPDPIVWENYPESLQALPFGRAYLTAFILHPWWWSFSCLRRLWPDMPLQS